MTVEFFDKSTVLLHKVSGSDDDAAMAAWVSLNKDDEARLEDRKRVEGLINFLWRDKHTSPFEHSHFTFRITTPIFVAREVERHRTASYNEESGRYSEMKPHFYLPHVERPMEQKGKIGAYFFTKVSTAKAVAVRGILAGASRASWRAYQQLLEWGVAREVARMILPLNLMTSFYMTINTRNLLHFLNLRTADQALYEIRDVADQMELYLMEHMPLTYNAWKNDNQMWKEFLEWRSQQQTKTA